MDKGYGRRFSHLYVLLQVRVGFWQVSNLMRSVIISMLLAVSLSGCATVSMVASEAIVETDLTAKESSLRKVSSAYTDLAERKNWIEENKGLLGFARVLMNGASDDDADIQATYLDQVQAQSETPAEQAEFIRTDIEGAAHGLDVATMEVEKLFGVKRKAKALRADLVSYESALVTAKKARRTFISALTDIEMADANPTTYALAQLDVSIDAASDAADKLADYAADRKRIEAAS